MSFRVTQGLINLRGRKILITAGPTREYWDPVRFLSNGSSGQMGTALALEAVRLGAIVTLVLGPTPGPELPSRKNLRVVRVTSALQMNERVQALLPGTHVMVGAAAVSDYRPEKIRRQKIKGKPAAMTVRLRRNPDIIANAAKRGPHRPWVVVGFALESEKVLENASQKLKRKGLDWIVANRVAAMGSPNGSATLLSRWGKKIGMGRMSKERLAKKIWKALLDRPGL